MAGKETGESVRRSVVFGGGGVAGCAWMTGLAAELRRLGIDLGAADSIVGTSAGAGVGAALANGVDGDAYADGPPRDGFPETPPAIDFALLGAAFSVLNQIEDRESARLGVGRSAMAQAPAQPEHIAPTEWMIGGNTWPDNRLRIAVLDAESGQRVVWDSDSGVELATAVTASRAFPGAFPPVVVDGRYYIDGGLWSPTNADVAADSDVLLVIEPIAYRTPRDLLERELAKTVAGTATHFCGDQALIDIYQTYAANPDPLACWPEAFRAGAGQAENLARELPDAWR